MAGINFDFDVGGILEAIRKAGLRKVAVILLCVSGIVFVATDKAPVSYIHLTVILTAIICLGVVCWVYIRTNYHIKKTLGCKEEEGKKSGR